jgi:quercetin dioxygenase-like cupin family protein
MEVVKVNDCERIKIDKFPYRGKPLDVKGISVRWLSKAGEDDMGHPEYGLRHFTAEPGGEIPIHNHFYSQTMYILSGKFECYQYDPKTDKPLKTVVCDSGSSIYIPSMEPHGMKNISYTEPASFLCCICNVYDKENL